MMYMEKCLIDLNTNFYFVNSENQEQSDFLRKKIMKPLVMAGTTEDIGALVDYLTNNGVRYNQEPYGPRPAKFAVVSEKMMNISLT